MRTTIDIPDELAKRAKKYAIDHNFTLRELMLSGLHAVMNGAQGGGKNEPIDQLAELDPDLWKGVDADRYVEELRAGWE